MRSFILMISYLCEAVFLVIPVIKSKYLLKITEKKNEGDDVRSDCSWGRCAGPSGH